MPTPSHGNPASSNALNTELNNVARNTDDTAKARALVAQGASLSSTNGPHWQHTPLHQAAFHGRYEMAKTLVELGAPLHLHSNPCGRGGNGTPLELARGGGHKRIAQLLEKAATDKSVTVGVAADVEAKLHEKVATLSDQLGLNREVPMSETVDAAIRELGLDEKNMARLSLNEKVDACLSALGQSVKSTIPMALPVTPAGEPAAAGQITSAAQSTRDDSLIDTNEIAGCWGCVCLPFFFTACFRKRATGPDTLEQSGCLIFPFPLPFLERRKRVPGTNGFAKVGDPGNIDHHTSSRCCINGSSVSMKFY